MGLLQHWSISLCPSQYSREPLVGGEQVLQYLGVIRFYVGTVGAENDVPGQVSSGGWSGCNANQSGRLAPSWNAGFHNGCPQGYWWHSACRWRANRDATAAEHIGALQPCRRHLRSGAAVGGCRERPRQCERTFGSSWRQGARAMDGSSFRDLSEWLGWIVRCVGLSIFHRTGKLQEYVDPFNSAHAEG